ncbi:MAG: T9SS type A sorting domain-containing protein [Fluviicola sp.]|nr:T9SS type A sorting domain-containing protein [Fluviicola sp.]
MKYLLAIAMLVLSVIGFSQNPTKVWETLETYFNGASPVHSIADPSGNVYATGSFVSKHDNTGALIFYDTYSSGGGLKVEYDNSGNTYVVLNTQNSTAVMVKKYSPTGTLLWTSQYSSAILSTTAIGMEVNRTTGDVFIVGYSTNAVSADEKNIMVLKYLTSGILDWAKSFDGGSSVDDIAYKMKIDAANNVFVLGETNAALIGVPGTNILIKYTNTGAFAWSKVPQTSGEMDAVLLIEGANVSVYSFTSKQRYSKSSGLLNETVNFQNTSSLFVTTRLKYWRFSDGRYVRAMNANTIKVFDANGNELSSIINTYYTDIQMASDTSLYICSNAAGDSIRVQRRRLIGNSYNWVDFTYETHSESSNPKMRLTDNNTFTISTFKTADSTMTQRVCIPPEVNATMTGLNWANAVCPNDTVFFNISSEYASAYSWWNSPFGTNADSIYIWGGNGVTTPLNLGMTVDAGNGCTVDVAFNFSGYRTIDTYIVNNFVGNCVNDQGYLQSLNTGSAFRFNWYYNGVQQTFDDLNYNFFLTQGNGTYELSLLDTQTQCRSIPTASTTISSISPNGDASFSYSNANYCSGGVNPSPTITGSLGGVFSSTPVGLSINPSSGVIDLSTSTPSIYSVSYIIAGACPDTVSLSVQIDPQEDASFSYSSSSFCVSGLNPTPIITGNSGGSFFGTNGLSINSSTGEINLSTSSVGPYTIYYASPGTCPDTTNTSLFLLTNDNASFSYTSLSYCKGEANPIPSITGTLGGTFSASPMGLVINTSTGEIDLSLSTPAAYTIKYITNGACPDSIAGTITINAIDDASFTLASLNYCENDPNSLPSITGTLGGTFSATPAGLSINPSTGEIDFSLSVPNTYLINYQTNGVCSVSSQVNVNIVAGDAATIAYTASNYCQNEVNPTPSIMGTPGGTFTSLPAGLVMNPLTGELNLNTSIPNTYTIKYLTSGVCPDSTSSTITINQLDDASFFYPSGTFCLSGANPIPTILGLGGGVFSGTNGIVINSSTGEIDIPASGIGNYTISYLTNGNCANSIDFNLVITNSPDATFTYSQPTYCEDDLNSLPQFGAGTSGGVFSATPSGLSINSSTGEIAPMGSTPNVYAVTNFIAASGGCISASSTFQVEITAQDDPSFSYGQPTYISTDPNPLPTVTGLTGGSFSESTGNVTLNSITGEIDLVTSLVGGPYQIVYTTNGNCPSVASVYITIEESLAVPLHGMETIRIYPNPTIGELKIDFNGILVNSIQLLDLNGRVVYQAKQTNTIDISGLKPAIYFLVLISGDEIYQTRIVKK